MFQLPTYDDVATVNDKSKVVDVFASGVVLDVRLANHRHSFGGYSGG